MNHVCRWTGRAVLLVLAAALTAPPVYADKPEHAGGKKHERGDRDERDGKRRDHDRDQRSHSGKKHFDDHHRKAVSQYYEQEHRSGRCPPGLARKNNGCMPPGQAKKWSKGKPLPRDVIYYDVPHTLVVKLGVPPAGHKYVRVASDILLIAVGSAMVVDAISDLGRM